MKKEIKKILAAVLAAVSLCSGTAFGQEIDWTALLNEKKAMASETDFSLYVQGNGQFTPYYGARLEPRKGVYFGMVAENAEVMGEDLPAYLTYFDMESKQTDIYWPANEIIRNSQSVATIGWTVGSLDSVDYDVIRQGLDTLAGYQKPMFIRFANEMNVSDLGNDPARYVEVFRRVADMVHEYDNFAVVWSPNDLGALDRNLADYYPGDAYVDWIGISSYMKKYFMADPNTTEDSSFYFMTGDNAWHTNCIKPIIQFMEENQIQKPVMISEGGVSMRDLYSADNTQWALPRLRNMYYNLIMKYPQVKLINYFNAEMDEPEIFYVSDNPRAVEVLKEAFHSGAYIPCYGEDAEFAFSKAENEETVTANEEGILPLYTLAFVPKSSENTVSYEVDGVWYHETAQAPYTCGLNLASLSDGAHTITIRLNGGEQEKSYTLYKKGNTARFGQEPERVIRVFQGETEVPFDVKPQIYNDRTMIPIRSVAQATGIPEDQITFDGATQTVTINSQGLTLELKINQNTAWVNGGEKVLDAPPYIVDGRTLVPLRFISETFGYTVDYSDDGGEMRIYLR